MKYCHWIREVNAIEICFPDGQFNGFFMYECEPVIGWNEYMIAVYSAPGRRSFTSVWRITAGWFTRRQCASSWKAMRMVRFSFYRFGFSGRMERDRSWTIALGRF